MPSQIKVEQANIGWGAAEEVEEEDEVSNQLRAELAVEEGHKLEAMKRRASLVATAQAQADEKQRFFDLRQELKGQPHTIDEEGNVILIVELPVAPNKRPSFAIVAESEPTKPSKLLRDLKSPRRANKRVKQETDQYFKASVRPSLLLSYS